jgi:hypothetical protein
MLVHFWAWRESRCEREVTDKCLHAVLWGWDAENYRILEPEGATGTTSAAVICTMYCSVCGRALDLNLWGKY